MEEIEIINFLDVLKVLKMFKFCSKEAYISRPLVNAFENFIIKCYSVKNYECWKKTC